MSSMLEEAIVDAAALKEAAQKSAEEKIIEHFSKDIKEAVDLILEQDPMADPMMGAMDPLMGAAPGLGGTMAPTAPFTPQAGGMAAAEGGAGLVDIEAEGKDTHAGESIVEQTPFAATTSDKDVVSIDLTRLEEAITANFQTSDLIEEDETEYEIDENFDFDDDDLMEEDEYEDDEPLEEELDDELDEDLHEDLEDDETLEEMIRNILAEEADDLEEEKLEEAVAPPQPPKRAPVEKKNTKMLNEHKQLNNKVKLLEQKLNKYQEVFPQLKVQLEESNLQNARLHYQNRVLNSDSLNERQKDRLVETISKAKTVEEAKIIYETLQSAVGASTQSRRPKSLNEVVTKSSSAFMPRKEEEKRGDTLAARMKALAGITDK